MKDKKIPLYFVYFAVLIYFEVLFQVFAVTHFFFLRWIYIFFYHAFLAGLFTFCTSFLTEKKNRILTNVVFLLLSIWFLAELLFKKSFHVYFSITTTFFTDQAFSFWDKILEIVFRYFPFLLLTFLPLLLIQLFRKHIQYEKLSIQKRVSFLFGGFCSFLIFIGFVFENKEGFYSPYELYFHFNNNALNKETFGSFPATLMELRKMLFPVDIPIFSETYEHREKEAHVLPISFPDEEDLEIRNMNHYFEEAEPTYQNEYTGYFKGKNLILFMAESFSSIAVSKELTPTLYRLTHEGFVFDQFYSPIILSTIGGEFQELTGLYPDLSLLSSVWKTGKNSYPFGYGNLFSKAGYQVQAYHNHRYEFQNRNVYLEKLGFHHYLGCGNGLEKRIQCQNFPESDLEMVQETVDDFIQKEKFFTYYVTVSGHMSYDFQSNDMAFKNKDAVSHLPYSEDIRAYLGGQIELDRALEYLISSLEKNGKLEDTVIALVGDHYPYDISLEHIQEIQKDSDEQIEVNRSHFILWNASMPTIHVSKVGGNMDVLPTILNLFDLPYDSRLIMGKDLLSDQEGLVIFADSSWVSDAGTYFANQNKFWPKKEVSEDYVLLKNQEVLNRVNLSKLILEKNYYEKVLGE